MVPWRASEDGFVTPEVLEWYECFARGQPGAIVVEATGIRDVPSGPLLRAGHDRFLPGLRDLVRVVREASGGQTRLVHPTELTFCRSGEGPCHRDTLGSFSRSHRVTARRLKMSQRRIAKCERGCFR